MRWRTAEISRGPPGVNGAPGSSAIRSPSIAICRLSLVGVWDQDHLRALSWQMIPFLSFASSTKPPPSSSSSSLLQKPLPVQFRISVLPPCPLPLPFIANRHSRCAHSGHESLDVLSTSFARTEWTCFHLSLLPFGINYYVAWILCSQDKHFIRLCFPTISFYTHSRCHALMPPHFEVANRIMMLNSQTSAIIFFHDTNSLLPLPYGFAHVFPLPQLPKPLWLLVSNLPSIHLPPPQRPIIFLAAYKQNIFSGPCLQTP